MDRCVRRQKKSGLKPLLKNIRWVSFDLYETLVKAGTRDLVFYLEELAKRHGININVDELLSLREQIVREVGQGPFITIKERNAKVMRAIYSRLSIHDPVEPAVEFLYQKYFNCPLFDDAEATIRSLRKMGFHLAVASNCDNVMCDDIFAGHGLEFDAIVTSESVRAYKPNPAVFRVLVNLAGVEPASILHVGDSHTADVVGAKRVGLAACLVQRPGGLPKDPDVRIEPDLVIQHLSDLPTQLTGERSHQY
jgi:2-haloalkanoic acid dehalogenase type II